MTITTTTGDTKGKMLDCKTLSTKKDNNVKELWTTMNKMSGKENEDKEQLDLLWITLWRLVLKILSISK